MAELYEIKSKAEYIQDLARAIESGLVREPVPQNVIDDIVRQLSSIADVLDEYHDFGLEEE